MAMKKVGYVLILLAMVVYSVAALFLDFYSGQASGMGGLTYFEALTSPPGLPSSPPVIIGGILTAFGGPLLIAVLTLLGLGGRRYAPARSTVVIAVATWSTFVVGTALYVGGRAFPVGTGFWVQAVCAGVAILGAVMLISRTGERSLSAGAASE